MNGGRSPRPRACDLVGREQVRDGERLACPRRSRHEDVGVRLRAGVERVVEDQPVVRRQERDLALAALEAPDRQHVHHHRRQRLSPAFDQRGRAREKRHVPLAQEIRLPVAAEPVRARQDTQRLLHRFLESARAGLVEDELERRPEDPLRARDHPLHRRVGLLLDRVRARVRPVRLDQEVLQLETRGKRGLRPERRELRAGARDVDAVVGEVSLAVEREERDEDAGLRAVGQLLQRDDADVAVAQPQVVPSNEQVVVQEAPQRRRVRRVRHLLDDRARQPVALLPGALGERVHLHQQPGGRVQQVVDEADHVAGAAALETQPHLGEAHLDPPRETVRFLQQLLVGRFPLARGSARASPESTEALARLGQETLPSRTSWGRAA